MTHFTVRRAQVADVDRLAAVWQEAANMLVKADARYKVAPDGAARWQMALRNWLERKDTAVFVAEQDNHTLAYIIGCVAENSPGLLPERFGLISDLAVDAHAKMGGIGRMLLESLKIWFREQGISHIEARVPYHHPIAQAFWRAIGSTKLYEQMWVKL